jgi:hypothetical protein
MILYERLVCLVALIMQMLDWWVKGVVRTGPKKCQELWDIDRCALVLSRNSAFQQLGNGWSGLRKLLASFHDS